ncbi:hypothetical protein BDA99DRAFT_570649 [Phascolomyces articulosus]|uniref:Uncharacterized protein n=1 Tax=Phascolomyces articulosus TaxID=60185 RepID=A0AAD5KD00_9FUNG|nr:hypothetical protein BDA99DRAFT_570649 [Phascolomyces articulosus]
MHSSFVLVSFIDLSSFLLSLCSRQTLQSKVDDEVYFVSESLVFGLWALRVSLGMTLGIAGDDGGFSTGLYATRPPRGFSRATRCSFIHMVKWYLGNIVAFFEYFVNHFTVQGYFFYHNNKNAILSDGQLDALFIICSMLQVPYQQLYSNIG